MSVNTHGLIAKPAMDFTSHPHTFKSFLPVDTESHFPIQNLPFGIFSTPDRSPRVGVAIGDWIVDLQALQENDLLGEEADGVFDQAVLNPFMSLGRSRTSYVREQVAILLRDDNSQLRDDPALQRSCLVPMNQASMHMPIAVGGFSDFMLSKAHSANCVEILGGSAGAALWPNWHYMPIAYNGRASSVVLEGGDVPRPWGQILPEGATRPEYQASRKLDFELEAALVMGTANPLGVAVPVDEAESYAFGVVLLNDWSARDIQAWEAIPLGVFVSKSHRTTISPWVVTLDALEPFRVSGAEQAPEPLPYLAQTTQRSFDVHMQASVRPAGRQQATILCRSNLSSLYWSFAQQIAHHTSTGCNLQVGDLLATGTVSGEGPGAQGCLYEATRDGRHVLTLADGEKRRYLEDGDEVELTAWAQADGYRVGFGTCTGRVVARQQSSNDS